MAVIDRHFPERENKKGVANIVFATPYDWCPGEDSNLHASQR